MEMVSFHVLNKKFLEEDKDLPSPDAAQQVLYYSLAIGHHVGVIDCLKLVLECPRDKYEEWITRLPEGESRRKMSGLLKFGEIIIDSTHIEMLGKDLLSIRNDLEEPYLEWTEGLLEILAAIAKEPAMYLMVRLPRSGHV